MPDNDRPLDRKGILKLLPNAQSLFDHSDNNVRNGKTFFSEETGGTVSTRSISIQDPRLNGGRPTLIPSAYDGGILPQNEAIERAVKEGKPWPSADSFAELDGFAGRISELMGKERIEGDDGA